MSGAGRLDESVKEALLGPIISGSDFGMPLNSDEPGVGGHFQSFDSAIGGLGDDV